MPKVALQVVPEPHDLEKTVFHHGGGETVVVYGPARGHDYVCGACAAMLIVGMEPGQIANVVVMCAACGAFNEWADPPA